MTLVLRKTWMKVYLINGIGQGQNKNSTRSVKKREKKTGMNQSQKNSYLRTFITLSQKSRKSRLKT